MSDSKTESAGVPGGEFGGAVVPVLGKFGGAPWGVVTTCAMTISGVGNIDLAVSRIL